MVFMATLGSLGEQEVIRRLEHLLPAPPSGVLGIGDDTAVVRNPGQPDLLYTTDAVIEGQHFTADADPYQVGHKAVGRVLSDIAAMGGQPRWLLVDVTAPPEMHVEDLEAIYRGMSALATASGAAIIGGDLAESERLSLHVFGVGDAPEGRAILRSTAQPKDVLVVTGRLGGSIHGRHLTFQPRLTEGVFLRDWATSMIDLSDGLATDIRHICGTSGVGALINLPEIPISRDVHDHEPDRTKLMHALTDGEDYELLFTVAPDDLLAFIKAWDAVFDAPCYPVGMMFAEPGVIKTIDQHNTIKDLDRNAFEHFRTPLDQ
ncbi:MAG: thiamine-monophosphate kinase [Kiritimatiellia bacterium]|jgi:thiamine-monophosphate kinase